MDSTAQIQQAVDLAETLKQRVRGDVRFDTMSRWLYSTDASSYQILPAGVVVARDADDVSAVLRTVADYGTSIVPRGGGTSLSGQTVGPGVVIDHSRYQDAILELNADEKWVRVQSGLVLDRLNKALKPHGLMVGPDPASSMSATLGGMTGNNSTGSHSIEYGMMIDHVQEVDVVLADGSQVRFGPRSAQEAAALTARDTLEGRLYRDLPALIESCRAEVAARYPKTWRNVAGYNFNRMLARADAGEAFSLVPLILGSEGTLGVISAVKLKVVDRPRFTTLAVLHFEELEPALAFVPRILEAKPSAVELVDRYFNHLTRQSLEYGNRMAQFIDGDPRAVLLVEFYGQSEVEAISRRADLIHMLRGSGYRGTIVERTAPVDVASVWAVRKAGLGLLNSMRGNAKPLAFVDDAAVPVDRLAAYALDVERVCAEQGTDAAFYAHASAGCLHINPVIDLKSPVGLAQMKAISQAVAELAIHYGGTTTGEHGEGIARSHFNEKLYGPVLHQAFRQTKALFDPDNRLNPGKVIDAPEPWDPSMLRMQPGYATPYAPVNTFLDFSGDGGFAGLVEMCNGQGVCRKPDAGVMCPSFIATRDEAHSTRGRANALRAAMTGQLGPDGMDDPALYEVLDLCLECKACKRECPSLVDMAKLKYEFLAQHHQKHGVPLRSRLFARIHVLSKLGAVAPPLTNWGYRNRLVRKTLDRALGIDARRTLPAIAPQTFHRWWRGHERPASAPRGPVILWDDTYLTYNEPEIGQAAVAVLEAAGFAVQIIAKRRCCGRPMISKGLLAEARANAAHNVNLLVGYAEQGVPIVGLEPSCIATFRDEYPDLLRSDAARTVARHSYFIEEFLARLIDEGAWDVRFREEAATVLVHGHCYQKALIGTDPLLKVLAQLPGSTISEIPSGCCGMAGSFGYEREHYEVSMAAGEDRLFPAVRAASPDTVLLASGISCRHQIEEGTARHALHPIIYLASRLEQMD
jgi:FAD/FMN-containing dehydrogenase/Fe-S oxidoreductase